MLSFIYQRLRKFKYSAVVPVSLILLDFGIILLLLDALSRYQLIVKIDVESYFLLSVNMALSWIIASLFAGAYQIENLDRLRKIALRSVLASLFYLVLIYILLGALNTHTLDQQLLLTLYLCTLVAVVIVRATLLLFYRFIRQLNSNRVNTIIIGNTTRGKELSRYFLSRNSLSQQYLGFFDNVFPDQVEDLPYYLGNLDMVKRYCLENNVKEIYYALDQHRSYFHDLMQFADQHFIFLGIIPDIDGVDFGRRVDTLLYNDSRIPVITARKVPLHLIINAYVKRSFDIVFSSIVITLILSWLIPLIAILIKLDSPGPVFFKQLRSGKNNRPFYCYKFRSMRVNYESHSKQATKDDSRITRVGAILRKTSIDELPQFFNVLLGDMSVVGPRPHMLKHTQEYSRFINNFMIRHFLTPGITGWAQVNGYRGETKEPSAMSKRVEADIWYMENWTLFLDIKIILLTIWQGLKGNENAF